MRTKRKFVRPSIGRRSKRRNISLARPGAVSAVRNAVGAAVRNAPHIAKWVNRGMRLYRAYNKYSANTSKRTKKFGVLSGDASGLRVKRLPPVYLSKNQTFKSVGNFQYVNETQIVSTAVQGFQAVAEPELMLVRDQIIGNVDPSRSVTTKWHDDPYKLNPFHNTPNSAIYPGPHPEVARGDMIFVKSIKVKYHFLNMEAIGQNCVCYFLTPTYDCPKGPKSSWDDILAAKRVTQVDQTVASTVATAIAGAGWTGSGDISANPFHHKEFSKQWRCVKDVKMVLQAGEQVSIEFEIFINKFLNREIITNVRSSQFLAGVTVAPLVITHGSLVGISATSGAQASEVAHGAVKIGIISKHLYTFQALPYARLSTSRTYSGLIHNSSQFLRTLDDDEEVIDPASAVHRV